MADNSNLSTISGQGIVNKALEVGALVAGKSYVWGGKTTSGFDCSGFVTYVFKQLFPNSATMFELGANDYASSSLFNDISESDKSAGDIILFTGSDDNKFTHIGIVCTKTNWIGCQSSTGVALVKFTNTYWSDQTPIKYRRLKNISTASIDIGRQNTAVV